MNIVIDAISDIFLSVVDMIFARKSDKGASTEHKKGKGDCHDQSR